MIIIVTYMISTDISKVRSILLDTWTPEHLQVNAINTITHLFLHTRTHTHTNARTQAYTCAPHTHSSNYTAMYVTHSNISHSFFVHTRTLSNTYTQAYTCIRTLSHTLMQLCCHVRNSFTCILGTYIRYIRTHTHTCNSFTFCRFVVY